MRTNVVIDDELMEQALRSRGVTVRKTIDVLIGTFCAENSFLLIHHDKDFAPHRAGNP
jgi:predicted nucleic acid-binding protein